MNSLEKCASTGNAEAASVGKVPSYGRETVEYISELFDKKYAKFAAFDRCAVILEMVFAHYDYRCFTDDLAEEWTARLSMTAEATECRGVLLVALYDRLVYKQLTGVADIDYSFLLKYLLWMTEYIYRQVRFEPPNKVRTLFDEAISLYAKLSTEKKGEVASIDDIYDLSTSSNVAKEYLAFRLLDAWGPATLTKVDLLKFSPSANRFHTRELFKGTIRGFFELAIKKAWEEENQASDMSTQSSDESRQLRLIKTAKAINAAKALARHMWNPIQEHPGLFVMDIARSVMGEESLSPADADVLFAKTKNYDLLRWENIDQSWRNAKARAAINRLERLRYDVGAEVVLSSSTEIWKNVPDSRLHEIMADEDLRSFVPWPIREELRRRGGNSENHE